MKYFIYILFFLGVVFSQDKKVTLPESEVIKWAQSLQKFEKSDSLQKVLISDLELQIRLLEENSFSDSLIISNQELQIQLLKDTNNLMEKKVKLVKPRWYENKWLWFGYGLTATATSVWLTGQLVK